MTTTVDALKAAYVALGGSADDVKNITLIPDMITAITPVLIVKIGSVLPTVTAADNGSVLKVADGKWAVGTDATE